jgi:(1->4)-alpha-D-glucan 1-alpha-D-glucosylmutase
VRSDPRATYRLQLHQDFPFAAAAALAPYLEALGVSHVYCSPYLQAAPGSRHGYDVVDHAQVNEELGGPAAHEAFCMALGRHHLGQLLDIVPNHMAIGTPRNRWWWDVLENGPASRYASYFDVEWSPPEAKLRNTTLLPMLGDHFGRVLERREIKVERRGGSFVVRYYDHEWPVAPRSMSGLLAEAAEACRSDELAFVADALAALDFAAGDELATVRRRHRHKEVLRGLLQRLCADAPDVARAVDDVVARVNDDPAALGALLDEQNYRVAFWKTASRELGYRRFFDVNTLAGLRIELDRVFLDTHDLVLRWLDGGVIDGLRIDHPDGLREPEAYFRRLQAARPRSWVVVEKILIPGERLPESWPVSGTTGYDFLNRVGGLFVDPEGEAPLTALYAELTGEARPFEEVLLEGKRTALRESLGSDLNRLTALLVDVGERHPRHRDYTRHDLHEALADLVAVFPVYRTYVSAATGELHQQDVATVERAVRAAMARWPRVDPQLFEFVRDLLLLRHRGPAEDEFVMRFQQLTGPAMAKGAEDTAFYRYHRLAALNEVGGEPSRFGTSLAEFHAACAEAQRRWPRALLATSTHDTKRSEDVRLRIAALSEVPEDWGRAVRGWYVDHEASWPDADRNLQYLVYQTLVGAWPIGRERLHAYVEKAAREAKTHTSWTAPNESFEKGLHTFVDHLLDDAAFLRSLQAFVEPLLRPARLSSLSQVLLRHTCPGVGDVYQGTEVWDLSLVDPDNRRPVDYEARSRLLREVREATPEAVLARMDEGAPKVFVLHRALQARLRRAPEFSEHSTYEPLLASGPRADHVAAFRRGRGVVVVAPRLWMGLRRGWGSTSLELPAGGWTNAFTGERLPGGPVALSTLLERFPVALLESS